MGKGASVFQQGSVTAEDVSVLARVFGVPVDGADILRIADELQTQLAVCQTLDDIELEGVDPAQVFDPRWA